MTFYQIVLWKDGQVINATTKYTRQECLDWIDAGSVYDHYTFNITTI